MAARKQKSTSRIPVPDTARKVDSTLSGFWKPSEAGQAIQGVVGRMVETKGADGRPNQFYMVRITNVESAPIVGQGDAPVEVEHGMVVGVGGRTLAGFFEQNPGAEVLLVYTGLGPKKPGKNQAKLYDTYIIDESGESE